MRTTQQIRRLLKWLEHTPAEALEAQDLEFQPHVQTAAMLQSAIGLANGGGGSLVLGVETSAIGLTPALRGVPSEVDARQLERFVRDSTDPPLTSVVDEVSVVQGTGRLLVMHIYPGLPPYSDREGRGTVRVRTEAQALTDAERRRILATARQVDYTSAVIPGDVRTLISIEATRALRALAASRGAAAEVLERSDVELLRSLHVLRSTGLTRAGVLLAGNDSALREHVPAYGWSWTSTNDRVDGIGALPLALEFLQARLAQWDYPEIALREALINAFVHADLVAGRILVQQFSDRLVFCSPGSLSHGVRPDNILQHAPVSRNALLVDALMQLGLVDRRARGMQRMYRAFLEEGRSPPGIRVAGAQLQVTFQDGPANDQLRAWVQSASDLSVEAMLVLHFLSTRHEIDLDMAAALCHVEVDEAADILTHLERTTPWVEATSNGWGRVGAKPR